MSPNPISPDADDAPPPDAAAGWEPTRAAALQRLRRFLPRAGTDYARDRNHDRGTASGVSGLSPYVRRRLIGEDEIVDAVLARHSVAAAERFVHEVCWRTYWKGWLELRPAIWERYRTRVAALEQDPADGVPRAALDTALAGRTGLACFDHWVRELVDTGYLHNHARMWFASIWIFTLRLPWELGAAFFLRHLLDGDPASNTLSWRWVAGLQTQGKHYLARAENIARFTDGRFNPVGQLDEHAPPLPPDPIPAARPLAALPPVAAAARSAWLLHDEDLSARWPANPALRPVAVIGFHPPAGPAEPVRAFARAALEDALTRAGNASGLSPMKTIVDVLDDREGWIDSLRPLGVTQLVTAEAPVGPVRAQLDALTPALAARGIALRRVRRDWDAAFWPLATRGFFPFRESIGARLCELGITGARGEPQT